VLILGQGVNINGSALIDGLRAELGDEVAITGGLAGDGARFQETVVVTPQGVSSTAVVAVGLGGEALRFQPRLVRRLGALWHLAQSDPCGGQRAV
jgi:hypothetical protein